MNISRHWKALGTALVTATMFGAATLMPAFAQDTTLKFLSWQKDEPGYGDWWAALVTDFEAEHPGVKIEFNKIELSALPDTMTTLFAGGQPPDILHFGAGDFQKFANQGWLEDLAPWLAKDNMDVSNWAGENTCVWKGETVCIMMLYFGYIMAYNAADLESIGAPVPTTYEQMIDDVKKLTADRDGDGIVDHWGLAHQTASPGGSGTGYLNGMLHYMLDAGSHWTDDNGKLVVDSPAVIEGLRRWKEIIQKGLTPPDLTSGQARQLFADGKVTFQFEGPWIYPIMESATPEVRPNLKLAMVPFKTPVGGSSNVLAMPTDITPEKKALVWDFIKLSMSPKFQSLFASLGASAPPSPTADVSGAYAATPHFDLLVEAQKAAAAGHVERTPKGLEAVWNEFAKMAMEETQRMIIDDLDPAEVAKTIQAKGLAIQGQ